MGDYVSRFYCAIRRVCAASWGSCGLVLRSCSNTTSSPSPKPGWTTPSVTRSSVKHFRTTPGSGGTGGVWEVACAVRSSLLPARGAQSDMDTETLLIQLGRPRLMWPMLSPSQRRRSAGAHGPVPGGARRNHSFAGDGRHQPAGNPVAGPTGRWRAA